MSNLNLQKLREWVWPSPWTFKCSDNEYLKYCDKPTANSMYCEPCCHTEIFNIVHSFQNVKAPGSDNIGPKLLKSCLNAIIDPLTYIFDLSLTTGAVPNCLKIAKVIPVHKKGDISLVNNYRPISLLSIFDKILEKLMCRRLSNFLSKNNILYDYRSGFRKTIQLYWHLLSWQMQYTVT